ncbi:MAG: DUF4430 domain-containing protein [Thermoanaerobacterales bacterium]|nr:DUF4430 domain-containing protein [Thermoanaerobacterales bacterium]
MKRSFLIPLVLVLLGILVPVVYTTTRGGEAHDPPSSASIDTAVEEEKAQGEVEKKQQDQEKEDEVSGDESKEQQKSPETAVSNQENSNKGSQSKEDNKSAVKQPTGQSSSSSQGKKQDTSGKTSTSAKKVDGPAPGYIRVTVTIVGKNGKIMYNSSKVDVKEKGTVLDALYATGVSCKVRSDGYVRAIAGLAENANGEGWMYSVSSVNGGSPPPYGADKCTVKNGDRIIWFYGSFMDPPPKL